jgi:hypothetical protein
MTGMLQPAQLYGWHIRFTPSDHIDTLHSDSHAEGMLRSMFATRKAAGAVTGPSRDKLHPSLWSEAGVVNVWQTIWSSEHFATGDPATPPETMLAVTVSHFAERTCG